MYWKTRREIKSGTGELSVPLLKYGELGGYLIPILHFCHQLNIVPHCAHKEKCKADPAD